MRSCGFLTCRVVPYRTPLDRVYALPRPVGPFHGASKVATASLTQWPRNDNSGGRMMGQMTLGKAQNVRSEGYIEHSGYQFSDFAPFGVVITVTTCYFCARPCHSSP